VVLTISIVLDTASAPFAGTFSSPVSSFARAIPPTFGRLPVR